MPPLTFTPNQCVAWNLTEARKLRGWTQEEAADRLEPYLGERWSKATFSAAERSIDGTRIRQFTADDIYAFARGFDLPMTYFFRPPRVEDFEIGHANSDETVHREALLNMVFDVGEEAHQWLLREAVPLSAETTRALRRWGEHFAAMVDHREREVKGFEALLREGEQ